MIISTEVETIWNPSTREHYISKGYSFTKHREILRVSVNDLTLNSSVLIEVECDYCKKHQKKEYGVIWKSIDNCILGSYSCADCKGKKTIAQHNEKQRRGLLSRGDKGYWRFEENRIKELQLFIELNGSINGIRSKDGKLYEEIIKYDKSLEKLVKLANYNWDEVSSISPTNYNKDFENVKRKIECFIEENNRFPLWEEITKVLKIQIKDISYHGGIDEIKKKIGYSSEDNLIDDRGYPNKSGIEYMVAQYLIKNGISYLRDKEPFISRKFTCDFYLEGENKDAFYVEVWGYRERDTGKVGKRYSNSKKEKIKLYNENRLNLISINYEDVERLTFDEIQYYIKNKFSKLNGKNFKIFENCSFMRPNKLTDEEILNEIMKYSDNPNKLPPQRLLHEAGLYSYIMEIRKRYVGYQGFADAFNKTLSNHATRKVS